MNTAGLRLTISTVGLLLVLKLLSLFRNHRIGAPLPSRTGLWIYLLLWPGVRPESFTIRRVSSEQVGKRFVEGFGFFLAGVALQLVLALRWPDLPAAGRSMLGLVSFLVIVHFGISSMAFAVLRILRWPVEPLFEAPFQSTSLREFWSRRWNLAFVDMDKRLVLPLLPTSWSPQLKALGIFLVSGILHEIGISFPADGGWGGPLSYFILHGALAGIEPRMGVRNWPAIARRLWVWSAILIPLPLLFHRSFMGMFIDPYFESLSGLLRGLEWRELLHMSLVAAGVGHALVLAASFQVPSKLRWKEDFAKLNRFNRKIFWTYGGYIVFCIIAFSITDFFNVRGLLDIHPSSLVIALFIAVFWTARVVTDFAYFGHADWPPGDEFVVGHACLTALFCFLALSHWGLVAWQLIERA